MENKSNLKISPKNSNNSANPSLIKSEIVDRG